MSRLTASPFHKPSVFDSVQRVPLSPPETNLDGGFTNTASVARGMDAHHNMDTDHPPVPRPIDGLPEFDSPSMSPAARFRKVSSMAYLNSGLREARDRSASKPNKQFVIVIPPPTFQHEHGTLGHTLASGPAHRHSHGIILPLFPTFYGQVTAIAREWNFPSTAGICLYLQHMDNNVISTPRISDETWQILWSNILDPVTTTSAPRPPIVAKLEFDLDMRIARWYSSWLASSHRDTAYDIPASVAPSVTPSEGRGHFNRDSRTTYPEDDIQDDRSVATRFSSATRPRHVPKKLSLVDRFDAASVRKAASSRPAVSPPEVSATQLQSRLSPIQQLEEPRSAGQDLATKVMSWRASAGHKSHLLANGQISLDPANMPNFVDIDSPKGEGDDEELNLADFTWSISSAGPPSWYGDDEGDVDSYYVPSVHLDRRLQGSVCLSPSICTSFGPSDYSYSEGEPDIYSRVATPDIAWRMLDDCPPSPSVCTSFGPPDYSLSDIESIGRLPSPDIAYRMLDDCPPSPSICTSFPGFSPPPSPLEYSRPPSVDLGQRNMFSRPATPSTATTWGPPLSFPPSPATPFYVETPDIGHRVAESPASSPRMLMSFPYYDPYQGHVWPHVWPFNINDATRREAPSVRLSQPPRTRPWRHVWPYTMNQITHDESPDAPKPQPWRHVWPYGSSASVSHAGESAVPNAFTTFSGYPYFQLYPPQYPHNLRSIYPTATAAEGPTRSVTSKGYPFNLECIYPPVRRDSSMPRASPSPAHTTARMSSSMPSEGGVHVKVFHGYPNFELYTPCYPHNLTRIYPTKVPQETRRTGYPDFVLYLPVASQRKISPSAAKKQDSAARSKEAKSITIRLGSQYPHFILYPPVHPHNLRSLYPPSVNVSPAPTGVDKRVNVRLGSQYPHFILYAPVYPYNLRSLYPPSFNVPSAQAGVDIRLPPGYPHLEIYRPVYPYNLLAIYPPAPRSTTRKLNHERPLAITQYPYFQLYPKRYPFSVQEIYPRAVQKMGIGSTTMVTATAKSGYPHFSLYPAVYPHFDLYPAVKPKMGNVIPPRPRKTHAELHQIVLANKTRHSLFKPRRRPLKTHLDLHREVFPFGAPVQARLVPSPSQRSPSSSSPTRSPKGPRPFPPGRLPPPAAPLPQLPGQFKTSPTNATPRRALSFRQPPSDSLPSVSLSRHGSAAGTSDTVPRHRKRDSLVLQRVRALNSVTESAQTTRHSSSISIPSR